MQLPGPGTPGAKVTSDGPGTSVTTDDDSVSGPGPGHSGITVTNPKSINTEPPAPNSYICLGYTFSIIAGFCFTSWLVLQHTIILTHH